MTPERMGLQREPEGRLFKPPSFTGEAEEETQGKGLTPLFPLPLGRGRGQPQGTKPLAIQGPCAGPTRGR